VVTELSGAQYDPLVAVSGVSVWCYSSVVGFGFSFLAE